MHTLKHANTHRLLWKCYRSLSYLLTEGRKIYSSSPGAFIYTAERFPERRHVRNGVHLLYCFLCSSSPPKEKPTTAKNISFDCILPSVLTSTYSLRVQLCAKYNYILYPDLRPCCLDAPYFLWGGTYVWWSDRSSSEKVDGSEVAPPFVTSNALTAQENRDWWGGDKKRRKVFFIPTPWRWPDEPLTDHCT